MNAWYAIGFLAALAAGAGVVAAHRLHRAWRTLVAEQAATVRRVGALERDFAAVLSCSRHLGARLLESERARETLQRQIDKLRQLQDSDEHLPVHHAMKLLDTGVAIEEVIRVCELSAGEAEILQGLARYRSAA